MLGKEGEKEDIGNGGRGGDGKGGGVGADLGMITAMVNRETEM